MTDQQNWAGNYRYTAARQHYPETLDQILDLVKGCRKVRALGSRHSFNHIADCEEDQISLKRFQHPISIDSNGQTVTVGGGTTYGQLCKTLHEAGFAIPNMASLPHISIAGACATATHGSGASNGCLATAVSALQIVNADGQLVNLSRENDGEEFNGAVVNLGALGIVITMTLDLIPTFYVRQVVYEGLSMEQAENNLEAILTSAYSVSLFTDWGSGVFNQVWQKRRVTTGLEIPTAADWFGARLATKDMHPISDVSAENCTPQMGMAGPWHERLPHFKMDYLPSSGDELQSEYLIPRQHALAAIQAINGLRDSIKPLLQISEIRTIAADSLWMSPFYKQPCLAIHFTWKQDWQGVRNLLPRLEEILAPFGARPHWGKLFTMNHARLQSLYEKLEDFKELIQGFDPEGKFRNAFLDSYLYGSG